MNELWDGLVLLGLIALAPLATRFQVVRELLTDGNEDAAD